MWYALEKVSFFVAVWRVENREVGLQTYNVEVSAVNEVHKHVDLSGQLLPLSLEQGVGHVDA